MKILMTILVIALVVPTLAYAGYGDGEMFRQIVVLLELDKGDQQKLAVAFITLGENLDETTSGVGDENVDPRDMIDGFNDARATFRKSARSFLSEEQFEAMTRYSSAIFYTLAEGVAMVRVKKYQSSLTLSDDQVTALTLVVGDDLRRVVETFLEYDGRDVGQPEIDAMNTSLILTRENTRAGIRKVLTSLQWKTLQQLQEEEKAAAEEADQG